MDELVQHCLTEIAFEGELGCGFEQLKQIIKRFYESHSSIEQTLDDSYCTFLWSIILQQPSVKIGILPDGPITFISIPLQARKKTQGADDTEVRPTIASNLEDVPDESFSDINGLIVRYGERLRVAVTPEAIFVVLTGSHAKPAKLTPTVYAILQIVGHARESGVSAVDLGRMTGYDQKMIHYIIGQLIDLNLIVKLRRGGNSQNFCVHKYYFDRSPVWKMVREEEKRSWEDVGKEVGEEDDDALRFTPIDSRHLTQLDILRQRIVKLLNHSKDEVVPYTNIAIRIGFQPRNRADRRFFLSRLKELIAEGTVEKVSLSNRSTKSDAALRCICIRLVRQRTATDDNSLDDNNLIGDDEMEMDLLAQNDQVNDTRNLKANVTFHKQVIDLIEKSDMKGITMNELTSYLVQFDKRTIEQFLDRMIKQPPPPHLADLSIVQLVETCGKEKRHRYFTLPGYDRLMAHEKFYAPMGKYTPDDVIAAGSFATHSADDFYMNDEELEADLKKYIPKHSQKTIGRPRKTIKIKKANRISSTDNEALGATNAGIEFDDDRGEGSSKQSKKKPKEKKEKKEKVYKNPVLPDGTRKRGRPVKDPEIAEQRRQKRLKNEDRKKGEQEDAQAEASEYNTGEKRKRTCDDEGETEIGSDEEPALVIADNDTTAEIISQAQPISPMITDSPVKRKRGRPPKKQKIEGSEEESANASTTAILSIQQTAEDTQPNSVGPIKRKRGRPPKNQNLVEGEDLPVDTSTPAISFLPQDTENAPSNDNGPVKRKRGRPPKKQRIVDGEELQVDASTPTTSCPPQAPKDVQSNSTEIEISPTKRKDTVGEVQKPLDVDREPKTKVVEGMVSQAPPFDNAPAVDDKDMSDSETHQLGPVGKLVPASFDLSAEQGPLLPSMADAQNLTQNTEDVPESPLTELADLTEDVYTPIPEGNSNARESLFDTRNLPTTETASESTHTPVVPAAAENRSESTQTDDTQRPLVHPALAPISSNQLQFDKKPYPTYRGKKKNISQIRRENELVRLIESSGGIVNTSTTEFIKAYMDLVEEMIKMGETTSAPAGAQIDRRTLAVALDNLGSDGRIKLLKTTARTVTSSSRVIKIAHLPQIGEDAIQMFLDTLVVPVFNTRRVEDDNLETNQIMDPNIPQSLARKWVKDTFGKDYLTKDTEHIQRLLELDDEIIREVLLMERQTVSQVYGFVTGKLTRARALHVHFVGELGRNVVNQYIDSNNRVVDWMYFETEVPLSVYCTYMSSVVVNEGLKEALGTEEGRRMRVKDVPSEWQHAIRAGNYSSRDRIFQLMEILCLLKIVTPVRALTGTTPLKTGLPTQFEPMPPGWETELPSAYPRYWQFNTSAPIFLACLRDSPSPLHGELSIESKEETMEFWEALKHSSTDEAYCNRLYPTSQQGYPEDKAYEGRILNIVRRPQSWKNDYSFTWFQSRFLDKQIDLPQSPEDNALQMDRLAFVTSAPIEAVRNYIESARERREREIIRIRQREERIEMQRQAREAAQALLARKSTEAVERRESEWKSLVEKVFVGPVPDVTTPRVKRLHRSFILGNVVQDTSAWEKKIREAYQAAGKTKGFRDAVQPSTFAQPNSSASVRPTRRKVIGSQNDTTVTEEESKEVKRTVSSRKKKAKRGTDSDGSKVRFRRTRYNWKEEDNELACDAYTIIRARCRSHHRIDYGAFVQVFKDMPVNTIRQRVMRLRELPGAESRLQRAEAKWTKLWVNHRGTPALPDDNPTDPTDFDLKAHIEFFRKHIDKEALRVGVVLDEEETFCMLPNKVAELFDNYDVLEPNTQSGFEFLSNASVGEEAREKLFSKGVLVLDDELSLEEPVDDVMSIAESALKVVIGTPNEDYDPYRAAELLNVITNERVEKATSNLLSQNVFAKLVRDPNRLTPGRTLKISEVNQNMLGGPVSKELFQDAVQSERTFALEQNEWREWPLISTDGDTAALLQLFSDHQLTIKFDVDHARKAAAAIDGNSKKADDNDIEIQLEFCLKENPSVQDKVTTVRHDVLQNASTSDNFEHGKTISGDTACCDLHSKGVVDCTGCIDQSQSQIKEWAEGDQKEANDILSLIESRRTEGLPTQELQTRLGDNCMKIVEQLHSLSIPLVYCVGYQTSVLVSAKHVTAWTITLPRSQEGLLSVSKCLPRRWLDINGNRIAEVWDAALHSVIGLVHLRPGISHADLRRRLKSIYDRQEVMDLVLHLSSEGYLICRTGEGLAVPMVKAATDQEEIDLHWVASDQKHWYMAC